MNLSLSPRQLSLLAALGLLSACGGETTLAEGMPETTLSSCDADGGVCEDGDVPVPEDLDVLRIDCCETETDVEEALCDGLYGNTLPSGLAVKDTCDEPRTDSGDDEPSGGDDEPGSDADPCAGLTGFEQIVCGFGAGGQADEPAASDNPFGDLLGGLLGGGTGDTGGFDLGSLLGGGTGGDTGGFDWGSLLGGGTGGNTASGGFDWGSLLGGGTTTPTAGGQGRGGAGRGGQ